MDDMISDRNRAAPRSVAHRYARLDTYDRPAEPRSVPDETFLQLDLKLLLSHLLGHTRLIVVCAVLGVVAAMAFGVFVPARYTVSSEILIDPTDLRVIQDDLYSTNDQRDALLLNVESKMRVLVSSNVLNRVIAELDLASDPEFTGQSTMPPDLAALQTLGQAVKVSRDEKSFVVTLAVTTRHAEKSVAVSQALVEAFKNELARADADGASRTAESLAGRLAELKTNVTTAEEATERFRTANSLQLSGGELVSTLSMTQLNTQVAEARQRLIQARTRYEELSAGGLAAETAAAQDSATLSTLRGQFASLMQEAETLSQTLGPRHPKYLAIQPQVAALQSQIGAETDRIVAAAKTDFEQAQSVAASLDLDAQTAQSVVAADNAAQVKLRELERDAASQAAIYEAFLARARQMAEREQINTTNIRVISEPVPPRDRSWPPRTAYLAILGAAFGVVLGAMAALALGISGWRLPLLRRFV